MCVCVCEREGGREGGRVRELLSCRLLSRLALPICLNYLYMINVVRLVHHDDDKVPETAFAYVSCSVCV